MASADINTTIASRYGDKLNKFFELDRLKVVSSKDTTKKDEGESETENDNEDDFETF